MKSRWIRLLALMLSLIFVLSACSVTPSIEDVDSNTNISDNSNQDSGNDSTNEGPTDDPIEAPADEQGPTIADVVVADGKLIITMSDGTVLEHTMPKEEAHEHTEGDWISLQAVSCAQKGFRYKICEDCKVILTLDVIEPTSHTPGEWIVVKEPTGYEEGLKRHVCADCGATLAQEVIPVGLLMTLSYDDYVARNGAQIEILDDGRASSSDTPVVTVTSGYLVATNVGQAKIKMDGKIYNVTVAKAKINMIMIMGQSNAGNHFANAISDVTCPVGTAYWWGNNQGTAANAPVSYTSPSLGFHTPLLAELYAQSVAAGDPVKNVMIWHEGATSKNGQSIKKWASSATNTSGTNDAVTMLEKCSAYYEQRSDKFEVVSKGIYWLQGETDEAMDPEIYTTCFEAMWQRLKSAGMEYVAFLRVRRASAPNPATSDDLSHTSALSAQIAMINRNPQFYMATTITENWVGAPTATHTVDISNYITMMQAYGQSASYTDSYQNNATFANGKLTTTMRSLFGSNNTCHYGKFGYGIIGADAAYNMYRALHGEDVKLVVTDTSGYANREQVISDGERITLDISKRSDNLSVRALCGSVAGTLAIKIYSGQTDITNEDMFVTTGELYGSISTRRLKQYTDVSIHLTYTTSDGEIHTVICEILDQPIEAQQNYVWDFDTDLSARDAQGEVQNSFLSQAVEGSYSISGGYLTGNGLQLALENTVELYANKNWSIEWKYGLLNGGTAGFLLCSNVGNTLGNKGIWHMKTAGPIAIADYADSQGYYNYTSASIQIRDYDCVRLTNTYDPVTQTSTISLWINDQLVVSDISLKGSLNDYHDRVDMTQYPLEAEFSFNYLGNSGIQDFLMNCQLDYLKISFGDATTAS